MYTEGKLPSVKSFVQKKVCVNITHITFTLGLCLIKNIMSVMNRDGY